MHMTGRITADGHPFMESPWLRSLIRILRSVKHEEQAYNSCKGILHMCNDVPRHIAAEAAQICIDASACKYTYFKKALSRLVNHEPTGNRAAGHLPEHENIRGRDCYQ